MSDKQAKRQDFKRSNSKDETYFYEIIVQGRLDPQRSNWFEGLTLTNIEAGENKLACTLIAGPVIDQPALYGLITKIRDLNLTLISVRRST
jgi:hypothetical protein